MEKKKILIADDDASINRMISFKLQREGYEATSFFNGREALEAILANAYDAVVLDIMMPGMNGLDVLKTARQNDVRLPIIILSAKGSESDIVKGLELGANDYLSKPFRPAELIIRVKKLLGE